jgi:hypothetical protein
MKQLTKADYQTILAKGDDMIKSVESDAGLDQNAKRLFIQSIQQSKAYSDAKEALRLDRAVS